MLLQNLTLHNFRNFATRALTFSPQLTVIVGPNSAGKTNILEGIYAISQGAGFRESKEEELINFEAGSEPASVAAVFTEGRAISEFKLILIKRGETTSKSVLVGRTKKSLASYLKETPKVVLFAPSHIEIITGSPAARRDYFNKVISQFDYEYKKRLKGYEEAIRKRNKILERYMGGLTLQKELSFWDSYMEEQSHYLVGARANYTKFVNSHEKVDHVQFRLEYTKNEFTAARAQERLDLDLRIKKTTIGPQKDDFSIIIKRNGPEKNVHRFGSRSEQRLSILWLKLNEIYYCEEVLKLKPLILFDDIFSEFDAQNKKLVLGVMKEYQSVMTTTEPDVPTLATFAPFVIKL